MMMKAVLRIRHRIRRYVFGSPGADPDPVLRGTAPAPDLSIIKQT